ncbi:ZN581 protein, partial [Grantiella picta]|nr:ZN581 protein [Grantiella picta]
VTGGVTGGQRRAFACPECGRSFAYLSYLQRHSIAHSEHKPHVCRACGKAFKRSSHLERHRFTHGDSAKPLGCPLCPRRCRDAGELAQHQRVHSGERPFGCPQCPLRFGDRNTLQRHRRRKHGDGGEV